MMNSLPPEVIAQLSVMPEDKPEDFTCAICGNAASNKWNWSPKDYERPPICKQCETVTGYAWHGAARHRTKPRGGSSHDRRNAMRIGALADAIAKEATRKQGDAKHAS